MDNVVDIFSARATPAARQARPALFRARMAWAARASSAEGAPAADASQIRAVAGVFVGDAVDIETHPGRKRRGVVIAWEAGTSDTASIAGAFPVARVRLDPLPGMPAGTPTIIRAPRWRIHPVKD
ncbi:hypothetical protein [uncultured Caulobacter sp.]|uniref:hypothetical protein n=1 Tax=uncultured Caulobacter sp. TaxID=158749 RepID=UPI002608F033|nr:hypothetical protein [uncultured Caulobacter sp.]